MLVAQHHYHHQSFVAAYLHANPSVRLMSLLTPFSLMNPTAGSFSIPLPGLEISSGDGQGPFSCRAKT